MAPIAWSFRRVSILRRHSTKLGHESIHGNHSKAANRRLVRSLLLRSQWEQETEMKLFIFLNLLYHRWALANIDVLHPDLPHVLHRVRALEQELNDAGWRV